MRKPAFTLEQLRSFVAVAESEHISRAAASLFLTQGAVTQQIRHFEQAVGVQLLERDGRRVRLTDAGRAVHRGVAAGFDAQFVRWVGKLTDAERDGLLVGLPALIRVIRAASASPD